MSTFTSINPHDHSVNGTISVSTESEIIQKVKNSHAVKTQWKHIGTEKRIEILRPLLEKFFTQ